MNIKIGVSTWLWTSPFTTETVSLFPKIKTMGYDAVEIPVEYPEKIDPKEVKIALKQNGLEAIVCGAFGSSRDLTNDLPAVQENCFQYITQCLDFCNVWDATFLAGPMYSAVGKARMLSEELRKKEWDLAVNNLHKVCNLARDRNLEIALEPLNRFESDMINTADDVLRLVSDINHPAAKIMLDGFHMAIEERNIEQAITSAGNKLIHLQVSENYRGTPGTGQTPWNAFKKGLSNIQYSGTVSIESFTPDVKELAGAVCIWKHLAPTQDGFAQEGLNYLRNLFNNNHK